MSCPMHIMIGPRMQTCVFNHDDGQRTTKPMKLGAALHDVQRDSGPASRAWVQDSVPLPDVWHSANMISGQHHCSRDGAELNDGLIVAKEAVAARQRIAGVYHAEYGTRPQQQSHLPAATTGRCVRACVDVAAALPCQCASDDDDRSGLR